MKTYTEDLSKFPITGKLEEITSTLKNSPSHFLILTAETAAGKSTILPLRLLEDFKGKILMTEPRRIAALGVANRVSELIGEEIGNSVGYKVQLERKIKKETRLEVITEGILVRQLQSDPFLEKYNLVVLDEFHERSVNTDLSLAFLKETMELRDDLFVIIMSATIDTDKLQQYLGKETPIIKIPGRQFPVDVIYDQTSTVEDAIINEINNDVSKKGGILVFLPGLKEIRQVEQNLKARCELLNIKPEISILHSSISLTEQKKILKNSGNQRVILSSSIAETSLTVPGITTVIDSGLARVNRINIGSAMEGLYTEIESEFSADQRKGRAGRLKSGRCIRLWSKADPRVKDMPCEILRTDLTSLVLECVDRGFYSPEKIKWLDCPSKASWNSSLELLKQLGMVDEKHRITEKGKAGLKLGIHPRLASIALEDFENGKSLIVKLSSFGKSSLENQNRFLEDIKKRLEGINFKSNAKIDVGGCTSVGYAALLGYPDRLCRRISNVGETKQVYKMAGGKLAVLSEGKHGNEWIVAPNIIIGKNEAVIFDFENLDKEFLEKWLNDKTNVKEICSFENGKINKTENVCYGKIILSSKKISSGPGDLAAAWINEVKKEGLETLPLSNYSKSLIIRSQFLWDNVKVGSLGHQSVSDYLIEKVDEWLPPFLGTSKNLTEEIVYQGLYWFLKGEEIDKNAPLVISLPNGRKAKVKYEKLASPNDKNILIIRPVIEIIIQRIFGCFETPKIGGVKVLLRLLSPASRPLQITDDLEGFWTGAWPEICKEMKGRYPKHNWDEKICTEKD